MDSVVNVKERFMELDDLPALPGVALKILERIRDPESSMQQLAEILATDPTLSAKVLMAVNSPYFGLQRSITNLPHAVNLLGEDALKYIALSFSLVKLFDKDQKFFNYSAFWEESLSSAVICRLIAKSLRLPDAEDYYFLGLIHNIGMLALVQSYPKQYSMVIKKVIRENADCHWVEYEIMGFSHMEMGACLIDAWGLPELFYLPVLHHHQPEAIPNENPQARFRSQILRLSHEISRFLHAREKPLHLSGVQGLLQEYGLESSIHLETLLPQVQEQIEPLKTLFDLGLSSELDFLKILEDSKRELINLSRDMARKMKRQEHIINSLSVLATQDGLTKLNNFQSFQDILDRELSGSHRYGRHGVLALADLDTFKTVNDTYGHLAGDHVLQEVSRYFLENIRKSDVVARYGGEEFVFILTQTSIENGFQILDKLRRGVSRLAISYEGQGISISMSVGLAAFSAECSLSKNELLRRADAAMYEAKQAGRNRCVVHRP